MAQTLNRLSARFVETVNQQGRHADGGGLYLATTNGGRRWVFLFRWKGKPTEMGLGSAKGVSLKRARELAAEARETLARGLNPVEARDAERGRGEAAELAVITAGRERTFGECADELIANLDGSWRNAKHAAQWEMTLRVYAASLRRVPITDVNTDHVLAVLQPIWRTKAETASRVRGRIERVLSYSKAMGYRSGENPALWRGHLDQILPRQDSLARGHHKALPFLEVPSFMGRLKLRDAVAARALEFTILTAARTSEALFATWAEIDLDRKTWTVSAERMKSKRQHRVPLSDAALSVIKGIRSDTEMKPDAYVFQTAGRRDDTNQPLSIMALTMLLRRMKAGVTVHGFRSSFRDWSAECTTHSNEVCEAALAHVIRNESEAAYRRGDLLEKRRALMCAWASYCSTIPSEMLPLREAA